MKKEPIKNALGQTFGEALEAQFESDSKVSIIEKLNANNLPELIGWKEKQETLVTDNPFVEITDTKTYESACKARTNLLKGRTELEKQEKAIASKVAQFRKDIGGKTTELIEITLPAEQKQQTEVKRWEGIKEVERAEKERLEDERIEAIKNKATELESSALEVIQKMTYSAIVSDSAKVSEIMQTDFDFEEYEILYTGAFSRVQNALEEKVKDLTERENERIAREEAEKEAAAEKSKSDLQAKRLNEILPYLSFGAPIDATKLNELSEEEFQGNLSSKKGLHDAKVKADEKAEAERKAKEEADAEKAKKEKYAVFEIRKNRLAEIDFVLNEENVFVHHILFTGISSESIFEAGVIDFENILNDAKTAIENGKRSAIKLIIQERTKILIELGFKIVDGAEYPIQLSEKLYVNDEILGNRNQEWFDEFVQDSINHNEAVVKAQKEADEKASKADAAKLKKENAERTKRLKTDKEYLKTVFDFNLSESEFVLVNPESKEFFSKALSKVEALKSELLTEIENF